MDRIGELYDSLKEMEDEYQWTQEPELKLRMLATAREINDLLINEKYQWQTKSNWMIDACEIDIHHQISY